MIRPPSGPCEAWTGVIRPTGRRSRGRSPRGSRPARDHDRDILRLGLPALGSLIAEPLYILVDTAVVGHLGTPELGGLAVAGTLLVGAYSLFIFLAYGTTARVARFLGAGDERRATYEGAQAMWLGLAIGSALALLGLIFSEAAVNAMGARGEVRSHALTYLRISLIGVPALLTGLAGTGYLRGLHDARTPLVVTLGANLVNLVIEVILIFGLGFGIGASALSTVVAQVAGALVYVRLLRRGARRSGVPLRPDIAGLRALSRVSFDLFLRTASLRAALLATTAVAARLGTVSLAAHHIAFELWSFLALALDAIAIAGQAIIGRLLGAGLAGEARAAARRMIMWGLAAGGGLGALMVALRPVLPEAFTDDPAVMARASFVLWFVAGLQPLNGIVFVLDGVLIGAGDARFLAGAMAAAAALFLVGAVLVASSGAGLGALWSLVGLFMLARGLPLALRLLGSRWQTVGPEG